LRLQTAVGNGGTVNTGAIAGLPSGSSLTTVQLGNNGALVGYWNGNVEELAIWFTTRLANATLQAITT
jgi:hypothetical protein